MGSVGIVIRVAWSYEGASMRIPACSRSLSSLSIVVILAAQSKENEWPETLRTYNSLA